jgi:hypothetical protein
MATDEKPSRSFLTKLYAGIARVTDYFSEAKPRDSSLLQKSVLPSKVWFLPQKSFSQAHRID